MRPFLQSRWSKPIVFSAALLPLVFLVARPVAAASDPTPSNTITHTTGNWTLRFLLITLSITPLRRILKQPNLIRFRRMLGLFAFFYGCLHLMTWVGFDKFFDLHEMLADVAKRRFITMGMLGFLLMLPLALTSTTASIRRLGKNWRQTASADLRERAGGGDSLLVAGQIRHSPAVALWRDPDGAAGVCGW